MKRLRVDYPRLFTIIIAAIESINMWFRIEQVNEEGGRIPKKDPPPTPTDVNGKPLKIGAAPEEEDDG